MAWVQILLFGQAADLVSRREISLEADRLHEVREQVLGAACSAQGIDLKEFRMSRNQVVIDEDIPLTDGDEIGLFSSFSGG